MCELFGFSSKEPRDIREPLREFFSHSIKHPHGWGLMNDKREIIKEPVRAVDSRLIKEVLGNLEKQRAALAHIRLATVGALKLLNCHPYSGRDISGKEWTFIHNGTIYSGRFLAEYLGKQAGDTDSERVFLYMLDKINSAVTKYGNPLSAEQRFKLIDKLVIEVSPRNKLNLIIYDGEFLYAHKNMEDTLYYHQTDNAVTISTLPLDNGEWKNVPTAQLIVFENGEKVFEGTRHNEIFIPTLEYITFLDAMNI